MAGRTLLIGTWLALASTVMYPGLADPKQGYVMAMMDLLPPLWTRCRQRQSSRYSMIASSPFRTARSGSDAMYAGMIQPVGPLPAASPP